MKLGNTSQSIVPVPNFFYTRSLVDRETFHTSSERRYFREKDLFSKTRDMNFCNNPRNHHRKHEEFNKKKYIAIHHLMKTESNNSYHKYELPLRKKNSFDEKEGTLKPIEDIIKMKTFLQKTNTMNYTNPELKEEIRNNLGNLLDRINSNLNIKKFDEYDTKAILNKTLEINYTPITLFNQNNESESTKFKNILKQKLQSMSTVHKDAKIKALKKFESYNNIDSSTVGSVFLPPLKKNVTFMENEDKLYPSVRGQSLSENKIEYLSPTRREYADRMGEKISYRRKLKDNSIINLGKYNADKNKQIYGENYQTVDDRYIENSTNTNAKNLFY